MYSCSGLAESDAIRGREAVWDFYVAVIGAWRESAFETVELIEAGNDRLVQHVRAEMQGKASGAPVVLSYWTASTFRNAKVVQVEWFADRGEAFEAVGLRAGDVAAERGGAWPGLRGLQSG